MNNYTFMKTQICSNEHFNRLLKTFEKITIRVVKENSIDSNVIGFVDSKIYQSQFNIILNKYLFKNFKSNPFKTKSGVTYELFLTSLDKSRHYKFYVSYSFEDELGKRSKQPKKVVFRLYVKNYIGYRKKRLVKWDVPITWEYMK